MNIFYAPNLSLTGIFSLPEDESKHCIRVLRHKNGDTIRVVNGNGLIADAEIVNDSPKNCELKVIAEIPDEQKRNYKFHLAVALPKNLSRFEWMLEKCTEIGVDEVTPMICARSEKIKLNHDRMNNILISAMKQSLKSELPLLHPVTTFTNVLSLSPVPIPQSPVSYFIGSCEEHTTLFKDQIVKNSSLLVLIGPEGDFTPEELTMAQSKNFQPISLGKSRFRIETAAIAACHTAYLINQ